ncbi:DUF4296 domain-containing protein [Dyadobacter pollutisoli]|uniref:DUF4296 domain-containing protein n=1 Tax=Dyadobacter pollutisoli TaxID=2910158 RepID=A0A9E8SJN5_9BACT|nr:DUF4296 domain-containing protein [Dyadobacter pollutisoli]WAC11043.1 DUF4296 domain-containing protein [Dyadobacter pollutisoli]
MNFTNGVILFVFSCLLFSSCIDEEKAPKNTLSEEQMAAILTDIHLAESRVNRLQLRSLDSSLMIFNKLKSDIWKKHKVDTLAYRESYSYYMTHPQTMTRIYEKVNKKIEIREKNNNIKL